MHITAKLKMVFGGKLSEIRDSVKIDTAKLKTFAELPKTQVLEDTYKVLKKRPAARDANDDEYLSKALPQIEFFEKLKQGQGEDAIKKCYKRLKYESFLENEVIFRKGDLGDKFYIILSGEVGVYVPAPKKNPQEQNKKANRFLDRKKVSILKIADKDDQGSQSNPHNNILQDARELAVQQKAMQKLRASKTSLDTIGDEEDDDTPDFTASEQTKEDESENDKSLPVSPTKTPASYSPTVKMNKSSSKSIGQKKKKEKEKGKDLTEKMMLLNTLRDGISFGELALQDDKPRAATIICHKNSHFAVLSKNDYKLILRDIERQKIKERLEEICNFPIFYNDFAIKMQSNLYYQIKNKDFVKGSVLYKEGEEPEFVYFVSKGEFRMTKAVMIPLENKLGVDNSFDHMFNSKGVHHNIDVTLLGQGSIIGLEDIYYGRKRKYKVVCQSTEAQTFAISAVDFKKLMKNPACLLAFRRIKEHVHNQTEMINNRIQRYYEMLDINKNLICDLTPHDKHDIMFAMEKKRRSTQRRLRKSQDSSPSKEQLRQSEQLPQISPIKNQFTEESSPMKSPITKDETFFLTDGQVIFDDTDFSQTDMYSKRVMLPSNEKRDPLPDMMNKSVDLAPLRTNKKQYTQPGSMDRSFDFHEIGLLRTQDRSPKTDKSRLYSRKSTEIVREQSPQQRVYQAMFEFNHPEKDRERDKSPCYRFKTHNKHDAVYMTSKKPENSMEYERKRNFLRNKRAVLEKLEERSKTKQLNMLDHLKEQIRAKNILLRKSEKMVDAKAALSRAKKSKTDKTNETTFEQYEGSDEEVQSSLERLKTASEKSKKFLRGTLYKAKKQVRKSKDIKETEEAPGVEAECFNKDAELAMRPLPIANRQLRERFLMTRMKYQNKGEEK